MESILLDNGKFMDYMTPSQVGLFLFKLANVFTLNTSVLKVTFIIHSLFSTEVTSSRTPKEMALAKRKKNMFPLEVKKRRLDCHVQNANITF